VSSEHFDLEIIRKALYSGQLSAAKVDAQRAFERTAARLSHREAAQDVQLALTRPQFNMLCSVLGWVDSSGSYSEFFEAQPKSAYALFERLFARVDGVRASLGRS
jgi:hypothetical protein